MQAWLAVALAGLAVAGCVEPQGPPDPRPPWADPLASQGPGPGFLDVYPCHAPGDERMVAARNATEVAAAWTACRGERRSLTGQEVVQDPPPDLDLNATMVIHYSWGARANGGYSVRLDSVGEGPGSFAVHISRISPGEGCIVTAAITHPGFLAVIERRDGEPRPVFADDADFCR